MLFNAVLSQADDYSSSQWLWK